MMMTIRPSLGRFAAGIFAATLTLCLILVSSVHP
jgi:hypothetical protein